VIHIRAGVFAVCYDFPEDARFAVIVTGDHAVASVESNLVQLYSQRGGHQRPSVKFEMDAARLHEVAGTCEQ
jgi:hypothetical protein